MVPINGKTGQVIRAELTASAKKTLWYDECDAKIVESIDSTHPRYEIRHPCVSQDLLGGGK